jgi:hypothetical protein
MKKLLAFNILVMLFTACSFISCEEDVTDDKGIVQSIEVADNYNTYKKKYKVEVKITLKNNLSRHYTLYTDKSYRVGDSIFIK